METVVELSYDGFEDTPYYSCFITNLTRNGWATYYISFSSVDQLIFPNRDGPIGGSDLEHILSWSYLKPKLTTEYEVSIRHVKTFQRLLNHQSETNISVTEHILEAHVKFPENTGFMNPYFCFCLCFF